MQVRAAQIAAQCSVRCFHVDRLPSMQPALEMTVPTLFYVEYGVVECC